MMPTIARAGLMLRTVRHLKARQVAYQLLRMVRPSAVPVNVTATWDAARADSVFRALRELGPVCGAVQAEANARAWLRGDVSFVGVSEHWTGDWSTRGPSPLWRYHLHYHEHLADLAWLAARDEDPAMLSRLILDLDQWRRTCGRGQRPAWDTYPVSVRIVSWLRILAHVDALLDDDTRIALHAGLAAHVRHLRNSLEWHIDGNHLLRNAWALVIGSAVFDDEWARSMHSDALELYARLLGEQVHSDGWHEERSPMYHARILRDAIELEACVGGGASDSTLQTDGTNAVQRMADALPWMQRADGSLWQLNDTAGDHGVDLTSLLTHAEQSPRAVPGLRYFEEAQVAVVVDPRGDRLRVDLGAPAPEHQPGHAHAGALGFELDVGGVPCIVDRGCSGYDGDPWRDYLRSTAAHNTISVDGKSQSEMWATFRVGARAMVRGIDCRGDLERAAISATCVPFHDNRISHTRQIERTDRQVLITDIVNGAAGRLVESFLHFDPRWEARSVSERSIVLNHGDMTVTVELDGPAQCSFHHGETGSRIGWHAVGFNDLRPAWSVRMSELRYRERQWRITIIPR